MGGIGERLGFGRIAEQMKGMCVEKRSIVC